MKQCVVWVSLALAAAWGASPALADKAAYCQAYARDFSDARAGDRAEWQHKYEIALDACLGPARKPSAKLATAEVAKPVPVEAPAGPEAKPAASIDKETTLVAGSPEWNDYCARKYTSFNAKTGMYLSHTGVARRCLVTKG